MVAIKNFPITFGILAIGALVGIILNYKFLSLLKARHFEKWRELGSPSLGIGMNNSIKNNVAILTFLKNKEYIKINDSELIKSAKILWNYGIFYLIFFVVAIILFIINIKRQGTA
jgi:hypothetical protein